jgi:hypothetical protein
MILILIFNSDEGLKCKKFGRESGRGLGYRQGPLHAAVVTCEPGVTSGACMEDKRQAQAGKRRKERPPSPPFISIPCCPSPSHT